jgi:hypothetical protein
MLKLHLCTLLLLLVWACNKSPVDSSVNLTGNGSIAGNITDKYFYPIRTISNAKIYISSSSEIDSVLADSSGTFQFLQLPVDLYTLKVIANSYDTITTTFAVQNGKTSILNIELSLIYKYELGTVLAGFTDTTNVETVFRLFSSQGLTINNLQGFDHQSNLSIDSLSIIRDILKSKSYLNETDNTIFIYNGVIRIVGGFNNLDSIKMADWNETKTRLKIVSVPSSYRDGNFHTEDGQEVIWVRSLRSYSIIKWLELNYYVPIRFGK